MTTREQLPKITRYLHVVDHGPSGDGRGSTTCPHCGADGRYVHHFETELGPAAAMSGCVKLFPSTFPAREEMRLQEKERKLRQQYGEDAHLNSWDTKIMEAIEAHHRGELDEAQVERTARMQKAAAQQWRDNKYGKHW